MVSSKGDRNGKLCLYTCTWVHVRTLQMATEWHCTRLFLGVFSPEVPRVDCAFNTGSLGLTLHPYVRTYVQCHVLWVQLSARCCYVHMQCRLRLIVNWIFSLFRICTYVRTYVCTCVCSAVHTYVYAYLPTHQPIRVSVCAAHRASTHSVMDWSLQRTSGSIVTEWTGGSTLKCAMGSSLLVGTCNVLMQAHTKAHTHTHAHKHTPSLLCSRCPTHIHTHTTHSICASLSYPLCRWSAVNALPTPSPCPSSATPNQSAFAPSATLHTSTTFSIQRPHPPQHSDTPTSTIYVYIHTYIIRWMVVMSSGLD